MAAAGEARVVGAANGFTPEVTCTVSQYLLYVPLARKAIPPEVIAVVAAVTDCSSVVPSLSKTLPTRLPPVPQSTCKRYQ